MNNAVTLQSIRDKIKGASYTLLPNGRTTVCQLEMENGFSIEGQSACVDTANYNKFLGEKYAYEDALNKVWPFEGYLLAEKLHQAANLPVQRVAEYTTGLTFDELLQMDNPGISIALFYGGSCAPCSRLKPKLRDVCAELGISLAEFDTKQEMSAVFRLGIRTVPCVVIIKNKHPSVLFTGDLDAASIRGRLVLCCGAGV